VRGAQKSKAPKDNQPVFKLNDEGGINTPKVIEDDREGGSYYLG
jgi:hypothetical protein